MFICILRESVDWACLATWSTTSKFLPWLSMLVLASTWYQFDVTVRHLSSLSYLLLSLFTPCILLTLCVRWCITFWLCIIDFQLVTSLLGFFVRVLFLPFISQPCITVYTSFFAYAWSIITVSDLYVCIFIIFKLTVSTLIYLWLLQG